MYNRTYHEKVLGRSEPPKRKREFNWRIFLLVLLSIIILGGIVFVSRLPKLQVSNIEVTGTNVADPEDVSNLITNLIEGNILFVFPKTSMLFVPTATISRMVEQKFPLFESVEIRRKGINELSVEVIERKGKYVWCENSDTCFFMTENGLVYASSPTFSGTAYIKLFGGERAELPFTPLSENDLTKVVVLSERLSTLNIEISEIKFISGTELEVLFKKDGLISVIHFDPSKDLDTSLEALYTAMRTEAFASQYHDPNKILRYIDLRFPNKVVYKFE